MLDLLMNARLQTSDWCYAHVGELAFNYFMSGIHLNLQDHTRLWHDQAKLVGYVMLGEDPAIDWQILPEYEWMGVEEEALAWAEEQVEKLRLQDPQKWGDELVSGSGKDNSERIHFLEKHGFTYRGDFSEVNMLRSLTDSIPNPLLPEGFEVREFLGSDEISKRASIQHDVWQPWSVGDVSKEDHEWFMKMPGYRQDLDIVTVSPNGEIAAYVNGWIDPINKIGDIGPVGALEKYRRQALTRAALLKRLRRMKNCGMNRVCISTNLTNEPARQLYQSIGFTVVNQYLDYSKPYDR